MDRALDREEDAEYLRAEGREPHADSCDQHLDQLRAEHGQLVVVPGKSWPTKSSARAGRAS